MLVVSSPVVARIIVSLLHLQRKQRSVTNSSVSQLVFFRIAPRYEEGLGCISLPLSTIRESCRSESYFCDDIKMYEVHLSARVETDLPPVSLLYGWCLFLRLKSFDTTQRRTMPSACAQSHVGELYCMYFPGWRDCKVRCVVVGLTCQSRAKSLTQFSSLSLESWG